LKTRPAEIVEIVADSAHFPVVHRTEVEKFENIYEGHKATQHTVGSAEPPQGGRDDFDIWATYHGPAFQISDMRGVLHSRLFLAHTPIDENSLDLRFAVMLKKSGPRTDEFAQFYVENLRLGFHEDIAIWENKVYRQTPRLVDGDGPIGKLRTWYKQFFRSRPA
jgi:3-ketosteroid 9alpha-monooxygenase subunit A